MRKYGVENFIIKEIDRTECETKDELILKLNDLEKYYIEKLNTIRPYGYNISPGGGAVSNENKIFVDGYDIDGNLVYDNMIISEIEKLLQNDFCRRNITKCCNGEAQSAYRLIWRFHGESFDKYKTPDKFTMDFPIDQYSLDGKYIKTYNSLKEAGEFLNIDKPFDNHISDCCNGRVRASKGYIWRYHGDSFDKYPTKDARIKSCSIYKKDGTYVDTFETIEEACISIGVNPKTSRSNISCALTGRQPTAYGYIWKYN